MSLYNFVSMEFFKLKGNRTFLITVIGALFFPILSFILQIAFGGSKLIDSLNGVYENYLSLFSIIFAAVIINYLFTVDVETHTLKSIIPLPVSRRNYVLGKFITLLVWMVILALITIAASFILFPISGMQGFDLPAILKGAAKFIFGTVLLFLVMSPIAFLTVFTKNTSASLVVCVFIIFLNMFGLDELKYQPWRLPSVLSFGPVDVSTVLAYGVIIITAIIGYALLMKIFYMRDIPL